MLAGLLWGVADEPRYTATATVVAATGSGATEAEDLQGFAEIGSSSEVATLAAGLLGGDVPGADLLSDVSVAAEPDGAAISIDAISTMPDFAVAAANAYADALVETSAKGKGNEPLELGAAATIPDEASENRSGLGWSLLGLLVGLVAGSAATLLAGRLRRSGPVAPAGSGEEVRSRAAVARAHPRRPGSRDLRRSGSPAWPAASRQAAGPRRGADRLLPLAGRLARAHRRRRSGDARRGRGRR